MLDLQKSYLLQGFQKDNHKDAGKKLTYNLANKTIGILKI